MKTNKTKKTAAQRKAEKRAERRAEFRGMVADRMAEITRQFVAAADDEIPTAEEVVEEAVEVEVWVD